MEWILCRVVASSYWPTHNIAPHISRHDLPYHKTMKKYEDFEEMAVSLFFPLKFAIRSWFCNCPQYLCLFGIVFECILSFHDLTCEISLGQYVCELVFGINVFGMDLGVQIDSFKQPTSATLWVLERCLIVGTSSFYDHLDHCTVVFKNIQQSFLVRRIHV